MSKAEIVALKEALLIARDRIEGEDYIGTCGCRASVPKNQRSRFVCSCKREHDEILATIDAALNGYGDQK